MEYTKEDLFSAVKNIVDTMSTKDVREDLTLYMAAFYTENFKASELTDFIKEWG